MTPSRKHAKTKSPRHYLKNSKTFRWLIFLAIISLSAILLFHLDILDSFQSGYQHTGNTIDLSQESTVVGTVTIDDVGISEEFIPEKNFKGVNVMLSNNEMNSSGELVIEVFDQSNNLIGATNTDLSLIPDMTWYRIDLPFGLNANQPYSLSITSQGAVNPPHMTIINENSASAESSSDQLVIGFGYTKSTFSRQHKLLLSILVVFLDVLLASFLVLSNRNAQRKSFKTCAFAFLSILLAWTYMFGYVDFQNKALFDDFQKDSEELVIDPIQATQAGDDLTSLEGFHLGRINQAGQLRAYNKQYGLQGQVFSFLGNHVSLSDLNCLCSILTALVFVGITWLLNKRFNLLIAGCFYFVFWLSPWIVNFARNLYWVEFTWFLPMLIGLALCSYFGNRTKVLMGCFAAYFAILIKCLCGYEYISSVIIGLISFPVAQTVLALRKHNPQIIKRNICIIFALLCFSLLAFFSALLIHASIKGGGSLQNGLSSIFHDDVMRRTLGGVDPNSSTGREGEAADAGIWQTLCLYFGFTPKTQIIAGFSGNLFPALIIIPIMIFAFDWKNRQINSFALTLYIVFMLLALSWFVLAKSHSYVHTHMNYVLWYMGFVQICLYTLVDKLNRHIKQIALSSHKQEDAQI